MIHRFKYYEIYNDASLGLTTEISIYDYSRSNGETNKTRKANG